MHHGVRVDGAGFEILAQDSAALRCGTPPVTIFTLAVMTTSPVTFRQTKKKSSRPAHMLLPPPVTRYSFFAASYVTLPLCAGEPTSEAPSKIPRVAVVCAAAAPARPSTRSKIFFIGVYRVTSAAAEDGPEPREIRLCDAGGDGTLCHPR